MRIALVNWTLARGGAEKQCVLAAVELNKAGHEVMLFHLQPQNDYADRLDAGNVPVTYVPVGGPIRRMLASPLAAAMDQGIDLVHAFDLASLTDTLVACRRRQLPVIAGCRAGAKLSACREWLIRRSLRTWTPAGWVVNSPQTARSVMGRYGPDESDIANVPNAIDLTAFDRLPSSAEARSELALPPDLPVVTMVANFRAMKNHAMFFRVAAQLMRDGRAINFLLAGHGPRLERIERLRRDHHLEGAVRLLGKVKDIPRLLAASDLVVLTSHGETEGTPNALIEAGAAGRACVATRCGAENVIRDGETGLLVEPDDDAAMVAAIAALLDDPQRRDAFGQAGQAHVRRQFALADLAGRLEEVYRRAAGL